MAAPLSLVDALVGSPAASGASLVAALVTLAGAVAWQLAVVPRLAPQQAGRLAAGLALGLVIASAALALLAGVFWPAWPAALALAFGELGRRAAGSAAPGGAADAAGSRTPSSSGSRKPRPADVAPLSGQPPIAAADGSPHLAPGLRAAARDAGGAAREHAPHPARAGAAAASPPLPAAPERLALGRYRIDRPIGRGSMGVVYLGHDPTIGRQVAIKTMALGQEFDGAGLVEARARFFREAETAGRLQHRDIVTIFDAGEDDQLAWIAMEYLKGHDLQRHTLAASLLPLASVLHIVARVADAVAYAHCQGVVHRDIKPANVMIDPTGNAVKVTDFGIARITDSSRTRTGMVLGTPSFMSPEQMAGQRVDGRSDLYSLGVMLFQLLTGQLPHSADSMAKLMYQIANEPAPDVRTLRPELPPALADVLARALEKRPERRYGDGRQLACDLRAVAATVAPGQGAAAVMPAPAAAFPPESDAYAATMKLTRSDPGHNSPL